METAAMMGYIQFWGISPALDLCHTLPPEEKPSPKNILLSGVSDLRHMLKTLSDSDDECQITFYFHETQKEVICRALLMLHILHQDHLGEQELMELFLDLYGNALVRERSIEYLHEVTPHLKHFIHDDVDKAKTVLPKFVSLKGLKYCQRDDLSEIFDTWRKGTTFEMEKHRNQRIRHMYGERYDYRQNLYDWDFNFHTKQLAPIVHWFHYKTWRETGVAFEARFSKYTCPNKTLSSYVPGKKKIEKTSCLVRGFWGDIVITPYIAMGIQCTYEPENILLFKKVNERFCGHSVEVTEFNLEYWIRRLRTGERYRKRFLDYYRMNQADKQAYKRKEEEQKQKAKQLEAIEDDPQAEAKAIKEEETEPLQKEQKEQKEDVPLLPGVSQQLLKLFQLHKVQFIPLTDNVETLIKKRSKQFDVLALGFAHSKYLQNKQFKTLMKEGGLVWIEKPDFVPFQKKDDRTAAHERMRTVVQESGFTVEAEETFHFRCRA